MSGLQGVCCFVSVLKRREKGFTFAEMMISLTLMGVLASLLVPLTLNNVGEEKLMQCAKDGAMELAVAYTKYVREQFPENDTRPIDFINKMNYVRIINDSSESTNVEFVGVPGQSFGTAMPPTDPLPAHSSPSGPAISAAVPAGSFSYYSSVTTPCNNITPCALLHNGAVMQFSAAASFEPPGGTLDRNRSALLFILDPDGKGIQPAISFALTYSGRVTTISYSNGFSSNTRNAHFYNDRLPHGYGYYIPSLKRTTDPNFILPWTMG